MCRSGPGALISVFLSMPNYLEEQCEKHAESKKGLTKINNKGMDKIQLQIRDDEEVNAQQLQKLEQENHIPAKVQDDPHVFEDGAEDEIEEMNLCRRNTQKFDLVRKTTIFGSQETGVAIISNKSDFLAQKIHNH